MVKIGEDGNPDYTDMFMCQTASMIKPGEDGGGGVEGRGGRTRLAFLFTTSPCSTPFLLGT